MSLIIKNYRDQFGRIHEHKDSPSNNAWIYSAVYATLLEKNGKIEELEKFLRDIELYLFNCSANLKRHPFGIKDKPPMSHDEIVGISTLWRLWCKYIDKDFHYHKTFYSRFRSNNWKSTYYEPVKFKPILFFKQLYRLISVQLSDESGSFKRNVWWQEELTQLYWLTTHFPFKWRHLVCKNAGEYNVIYDLIRMVDDLFPSSRSSKQMKFLLNGNAQGVIEYYEDKNHPSVLEAYEFKRENPRV